MVNHYLTPGAIIDSNNTWNGDIQTFSNGLTIGLAASAPAPDQDVVHIWRGSAGAATAPSNSVLVLENSNNDVGLTFLTGNSGIARIQWGDLASGESGRIEYDHAYNRFAFVIEGTPRLRYTANTFAFQEATTVSTSTGALTLDPTTVVNMTLTANTQQAYLASDGSATYHEIDTRTTAVGVYAHKFDTANPTLASAGGAIFQLVEFGAFTLTLTGTTQVTSKQNHLNVEAMTITDTSSVTVDIASTLRIAGPPGAGGSVTITDAYALYVDAGNTRMDGALMVGAPSGGMKSAGTINAVAVYDDNSILTDWVFEEYYAKGMELTRD